jgi:peptide deformylase
MSVLKIIAIPNPLLKKESVPVEEINKEIKDTVLSLKDTLYFHSRCVGIAAVQTGILKRIILIDVSRSVKPHRNNGLLIMINPKIVFSSGKLNSREGCLSVPNFLGNVIRKKKIEIEFLNLECKKQVLRTEGFEATVIQHEIDHLDGKVFLDKISSLNTDVIKRIF